jgi:hypothetical protein
MTPEQRQQAREQIRQRRQSAPREIRPPRDTGGGPGRRPR